MAFSLQLSSIVYMVYKHGDEFWRFGQFHPGEK